MIRSRSGQFFDHVSSFRLTVGRVIREIGAGLSALQRVRFDEPWKPVRRSTYGEW